MTNPVLIREESHNKTSCMRETVSHRKKGNNFKFGESFVYFIFHMQNVSQYILKFWFFGRKGNIIGFPVPSSPATSKQIKLHTVLKSIVQIVFPYLLTFPSFYFFCLSSVWRQRKQTKTDLVLVCECFTEALNPSPLPLLHSKPLWWQSPLNANRIW